MSARRATSRRRPRRPPVATFAVALFLLQLASSRAYAAEPETDAQALVDRAYAEHAAGRDVEAVGSYLKAYELTKAAAILFNVAMLYERHLHERALALEYYRRYAEAPEAKPELVQRAIERLGALKREQDEEDARRAAELAAPRTPAQPEPAPSPAGEGEEEAHSPPQPSGEARAPASADPSDTNAGTNTRATRMRATGLVLGGVGLVSVGTSMVLGLVAKGKNDEANTYCSPSVCATQQGVSAEHAAVAFSTAATVTFVAGAVFLAAGVTFFVAAPRSRARAQITLVPQAGSRAAGLTLYSTF
jgi:hypothetical protein